MAGAVFHGAMVVLVDTLAAMTSARGDATRDDGQVVRVDLDGFPTTWPVQHGRWLRRFWVVFAVFWVVNFGLRLFGQIEVDVVLTVGAGLMAVVGVVNAVLFRTQRVQLEPEGYRLGDAVFRGRLRPWSSVDHVRPGHPRWGTHAEIRGRSASPAPVALHGMSEEQAVELQRRVAAAQAGAATAAEGSV